MKSWTKLNRFAFILPSERKDHIFPKSALEFKPCRSSPRYCVFTVMLRPTKTLGKTRFHCELHSGYADVKNPHKALSFAKRASTSDSPLVPWLLTAASLEAGGKAAGSHSTAFTVSFSNTLSLSIQELWLVGFLYLRPNSEHAVALGWDAHCWPSTSLRASLAWGALTAAELAFIFCRERDLCKGVLLFSVSGKQRKSGVNASVWER